VISDGRVSYLDRKRGLKGIVVSAVFTKNYFYIQPLSISLADYKIIPLHITQKPAKMNNNLLMNRFWEFYLFYEKKIYPIARYLFNSGKSPLY